MNPKRFWLEWGDAILGPLIVASWLVLSLIPFWLVPTARNFLASQGLFGIVPKVYGRALLVQIPWSLDGIDNVILVLLFVTLVIVIYAAFLIPHWLRKRETTSSFCA